MRTNGSHEIIAGTLECFDCRERKPLAEFRNDKASGKLRQGKCRYCKTCWDARVKAYNDRKQAEDPVAFNKKRVANVRKWRYGISQEQYDAMLEAQGGRCAICGADHPRVKRAHGQMNIDHDHETGRVRGLLCDPCNNGIGRFDDDPVRLEKAAGYVRGGGPHAH